ncbi:MAG: hypothetical protein RJA61_433 [Candidatus Parcubacteria bacterium]|jgi:hypothetical protein
MKKIIIIGVLLVGGFFAFNQFIYNEKQADVIVGESVTESGVILAIDLEPLTYDGPAMITFKTEGGISKDIAVPARGFSLCPGFKNVVDISTLKVGDYVEVRGELDYEGTVVPCEAEDHFLRVE